MSLIDTILGRNSGEPEKPTYPMSALRHITGILDEKPLSGVENVFVLAHNAPASYLPTVVGALTQYMEGTGATIETSEPNQILLSISTAQMSVVRDKMKELLIQNIARSEGLSPPQVALLNRVRDVMITNADPQTLAVTLLVDPGMLKAQQDQIATIIKGIAYTKLNRVPHSEVDSEPSSRRVRFYFPVADKAVVEQLLSAMSLKDQQPQQYSMNL